MTNEKFTFFWNGPFSQWHLCDFTVNGFKYNCAEQYMMAMKANIFNDLVMLKNIMEASHPKEQKKFGRSVRGFDADIWNTVARDIVYRGNSAKFSQNPELCKLLISTEGTTLVEASPYDKVWGIGLSEDDPRAQDRSQWLGLNWLGETLTELRNNMIAASILESESVL